MEILVIALVLAVLVWYLMHLLKASDAAPVAGRTTVQEMDDDPIREASRILKAAMDRCNEDHAAAVQALLWLAATDGTISKQEARNVFRFCEQQGSTMPPGTSDALEYLNNGMSITSRRTESEVANDLSEIAGRSISYRAAFIGAAHAICGGNKRISTVKRDFLDRANKLVEVPA